jgi:ketosteroid isomerase-like protein
MADESLHPTLQRVVDELDISQVICRYADAVDRNDIEQATSCFAPEAFCEGTAFSGDRDEYLRRIFLSRKDYATTQHHVGNQLREVHGDTARTETYLITLHFFDAACEHRGPQVGVRMVEELRREPDGRWVITSRKSTAMWARHTRSPLRSS